MLKRHPPRGETSKEKLVLDDKKRRRKSILRLITYYHPDKQPLEDEVNLTLSSEITKLLNDVLSKC